MAQPTSDPIQNMVLSFRVSELQTLLGFAGRNRTGRKNELQARALELVRNKSTPILVKVRELYKSIQDIQVGLPGGGEGTNNSSDNTAPYSDSTSTYPDANMHNQYSVQAERALQGRNPYVASYNNIYNAPKLSTVPQHTSTYPVHPDVALKKLPFYNILGQLVKPTSLVPSTSSRFQESKFSFHLTPQQATDVSSSRDVRPGSKMDFVTQIQMRFCLLETSCDQDDCFPPSICVKVNSKMCTLPSPIPTNRPGVEPKRPSRPVNISSLCKLCPMSSNNITVTWAAEYGRLYVIAVDLVIKLSSSDLLQVLKSKAIRHSDYTKAFIKDKLSEDGDCEIATTSLRVSLMCPLGKMRMLMPSRATTCLHLQCFDASLYLQMNERKPTWICPVCNKSALYDNLVIDGYFQDVLSSPLLLCESSEIQLHEDGSWSALVAKKEGPAEIIGSTPAKPAKPHVVINTVDSDDDQELSCIGTVVTKEKKTDTKETAIDPEAPPKEPECVDLVSSDEEEPPPKRSNRSASASGSVIVQATTPTSIRPASNNLADVITLGSPTPPASPASSASLRPTVQTPHTPSPFDIQSIMGSSRSSTLPSMPTFTMD